MAVAGEQILTRLGFEVDEISLKSSLEKAAAFGSALRRAFADASAAFVGVAKGEAEVAAQADALGVSVERFAEWRFIAEQTGASSDALGASLKAMLANNPGLSDAASELERAGGAMREMGDAQREAYARGLGIDPSLIPMLTQDVSGLRDMFRSLYATAGTDAAKAAEDGKGFLDGMARLAGLCDLLAKTVALSLLGTARSGIEALGDAFVAHFDDIRRVLELVVALASAAAPVIGAALYAVFPLSVVLLSDVIGAVLASLALASVKIPKLQPAQTGRTHMLADFKTGLRVFQHDKKLFYLVLAQALCMFFYAPLSSFYPLMTSDYFDLSALHGSAAELCFALGMIVSSLLFSSVLKVRRKIRTSYLGLLGMGAVSAACGLLPPVFAGWMAFAALCICLGASGNVHAIPLTAYIQETVEAEKMGRAFSVLTLISSVTMPVGLLLSSPIAEQIGVHTWFLLSGIAIVLMTSAVILWQRMRCRKGGEALDPEI